MTHSAEIPQQQQRPRAFLLTPSEDEGSGSPSAAAEGLRVLVVEDEALVAMELQGILLAAGHQVVGIAYDADSAVRLAQEHEPDVVLMDIALPGSRDGIDAAREITAATQAEIVFVTAHTDQRTLGRLAQLGFTRLVTKPFDDSDILDAIDDIFTP